MANIKIAIINESTVLTNAQVNSAVPALQTQIHRDFAPAWGIDADLTFIPKGQNPPADMWWIGIFDNSDQAGALGYHDLTNEGLPIGKVFAGTDIQYGSSWTVTASHELLEMLADPDINLTVIIQDSSGNMKLYAYEVCDAVENDSLGYKINDVLVSDFVYPSWFEQFWSAGSTQFDYCKKVSQPTQLLPGGYIGYMSITSNTGWQQLTADNNAMRYEARARVGSRRERRRTPKSQWLRSVVKRK